MRAPFLLGRMIFGGYFIFSGIHHFTQKRSMAQYAAAKHVPESDLAVQLTGAALIAGGASILLGVKPKLGTAAILMHDFWNQKNPEGRMNEMINFTNNLALAGGAMALMGVDEPWQASVPAAKPSARSRAKKFLRETIAA